MASQPIGTDAPRPGPPLDTRRNFFVFTGDVVTFSVGIYFIPTITILIGLASALTTDKALIGVIGMAWSVTWFLPQLVAARLVHGKKREKPYLIIPSIIGRQTFLLFALWLILTGAQQPVLTVWLLFLSILIFNICDSLAGVAWFDMLSRALTPRMRGRSMVLGQFVAAIGGIGAGLVVQKVLAPEGLPFPANYAFVFLCAWACFMVSLVIVFFLQENPVTDESLRQAKASSFQQDLRHILKTDRVFRRTILARFLVSVEAMAASFYVVFIRESLRLTDAVIGQFTLAFILGSVAGIVVFGWLHDRYGTLRVLQASSTMQFMAPLLAFVVALIPAIVDVRPELAVGLLLVSVALNGAVSHSLLLGYLGYVIDNAAERYRATYVGVFNTVNGVVALAPVVGGVLIDTLARTMALSAAYAIAFGIVTVAVGIGVVLSFRLPRVRSAES